MAVESGKNGKIVLGSSDVADVRNWRFAKSGNINSYASSSTSGHSRTVQGMKSGTLAFDVLVDPDEPIEDRLKPGDTATLLLYRNEINHFSVPCRIQSLDDEVQIEEGEPPAVAVEAIAHGAWTWPYSVLLLSDEGGIQLEGAGYLAME